MISHLKIYLRKEMESGFLTQIMRAVFVIALALALPAIAYAYTLVLKGGRQMEIPDNFIVTETTLTYEVAPSINVTVQMASIDIIATERINHETPGSLHRRAEQGARASDAQTMQTHAQSRARRTLTNSDLVAVKRAREESEARYEQRRRELGLPSAEESRRQDEEETRRALERAALAEEQRALDEAYWRSRAEDLRESIAELDAQINYFYARLSETPNAFYGGSFTAVSTVAPSGAFRRSPFNRAGVFQPSGVGINRVPSVIQNSPSVIGRAGIGGNSSRVQVLVNNPAATFGARAVRGQPVFGHRAFGAPIISTGFPVLPATVVTVPTADQFYYQREAMLAQLQELEAERAGFLARLRTLEDEARRAGVPPGWLR